MNLPPLWAVLPLVGVDALEAMMAVSGRRPKPEDERRNRMPAVHDWTIVQDVPFDGPVPVLPDDVEWSAAARRRWDVISRLPHAKLWGDGDWEFAVDYLRLFEARKGDPTPELRLRGNELGMTASARIGLRIRYVKAEPGVPAVKADAAVAPVAQIDDYRSLYGDDVQ